MSEAAKRRLSTALGYLTALCGPVISMPEKQPSEPPTDQPTAYSYNGVILPALPEWDREAYPYVAITKAPFNDNYYAYAFREPFPVTVNQNAVTWKTEIAEPYLHAGYLATANEVDWGEWTEEVADTFGSEGHISGSYLKWASANYDVYTTDGALYMEGTEPIPIYE